MLVEQLNPSERSAVFQSFFTATVSALVDLFDKSDAEAKTLISDLRKRFADAPMGEQNLLLHNDPVALASELAEVSWDQLDPARLEAYNDHRRRSLPLIY